MNSPDPDARAENTRSPGAAARGLRRPIRAEDRRFLLQGADARGCAEPIGNAESSPRSAQSIQLHRRSTAAAAGQPCGPGCPRAVPPPRRPTRRPIRERVIVSRSAIGPVHLL